MKSAFAGHNLLHCGVAARSFAHPRAALLNCPIQANPFSSFIKRFTRVNKSELVEAIATANDLSRAQAERALNSMVGTIEGELKRGGSVQLVGFGTFTVSQRNARMGKNPRTGEAIKIAARKVPKFSAGKSLKDMVAGKSSAKAKTAAKGGAKASKGGAKKKK